MRAIVCHAFGDYHGLRVEECPAPAMIPGGVRVAVDYASVSFSTSLVIAGTYQRKPPLPFVPGTEATGTVLETAPGVTACKPGDKVLAIVDWGAFAEEVVTSAHTVYRLPAALDSAAALHLGVSYGTAYGGLAWKARLAPEETLLVLGAAGGVGLAAVELGRHFGARVIAVAGSASKCTIAREHGAHETIDTSREDLRDALKRITGGRGVDCIFDPVGGAASETAARALASHGRIVVIGFASASVPSIAINLLLVKNQSLLGFNFGTYVGWSPGDGRERYEREVRLMFEEVFALAATGKLHPIASEIFPLEAFPAAMDRLIKREAVGKVALRVPGSI